MARRAGRAEQAEQSDQSVQASQGSRDRQGRQASGRAARLFQEGTRQGRQNRQGRQGRQNRQGGQGRQARQGSRQDRRGKQGRLQAPIGKFAAFLFVANGPSEFSESSHENAQTSICHISVCGEWTVWARGELARKRSNHYMCNVLGLQGAETIAFVVPECSLTLKVLVLSHERVAPFRDEPLGVS